jgi:glycosyltransferase involved in cell wall biosynthesis
MFSIEKLSSYPKDVEDLHLPEHQKIVMFAGRLIDMKGIKHLLAAETIYNNKGDVTTLVLGGGQLEDYVRQAASERQNVYYLGFKEQQEMPAYHRFLSEHHGVFSVPSSSEGLSIVYLETMASGNPIVGCCKRDMGELTFMQPPYAYFVPFGDAASLAQRILQLLEKQFNPHDIRDRMDIYNLHNMFNDVFEVYSQVYKQHYSFVCRNVDIVTP